MKWPVLRIVSFIVVALVAATSFATTPHPTTDRGFKPENVYSFGEFDSVNVMNGNLSLTIPIGTTYPVGDGFSYSFMLAYNSNIWDYGTLTGISTGGLSWYSLGEHDANQYTTTFANLLSNAGMGWSFSLGTLLHYGDPRNGADTWNYVSPDGAEHSFHAALHDGSPQTASVFYSRDGSYLRLRPHPTKTTTHRIVDHPDGRSSTFRCVRCGEGENERWLLEEISDAYRDASSASVNWLRIQYSADDPSTAAEWVWTVSDSRGRTHTVRFAKDLRDPPEQSVLTWAKIPRWKLSSIELKAIGSTPATYSFQYNTTPRNILRDCQANPAPRFDINGNVAQPWHAAVSLLESISMPEGLSWGFAYELEPAGTDPGSPIYICSPTMGKIKEVTLPTKGRIVYTYGSYLFPRFRCGVAGEKYQALQQKYFIAHGVRSRHLLDADGSALGDNNPYRDCAVPTTCTKFPEPWRYYSRFSLQGLDQGFDSCNHPKELKTYVVDPLGNLTINYFSIYLEGLTEGAPWDEKEYGLPFTKKTADDGKFGPDPNASLFRYLSTQVYSCYPGKVPIGRPGDPRAENLDGCTPLRSTFVKFDLSSGFHDCKAELGTCQASNRRVESERTVFEDDAEGAIKTTAVTNYSDFDGLGHFRSVVSKGNFGSKNFPSQGLSDDKTTFTNFNPGRSLTVLPGATAPWILGTYDRVDEIEGALTFRTRYAFEKDASGNPTTGFLKTTRRLINPAAESAQDLITNFTRVPLAGGEVKIEELHSGGDAGKSYRVNHTYESGVLKRSDWLDLTNAVLLVTANNTIDVNTGLVTQARDSAGVATNYGYDKLGRLTAIEPEDDARTTITYPGPREVQQKTVGGATSIWIYDGFGRITEAKRSLPQGMSRTVTTYLPTGWVASVSTGHLDTAPPLDWTKHLGYDPFGRPTEIKTPDGKKTTITYLGSRLTHRKIFDVALSSGDGSSEFKESVDRHGRLVKVEDFSDQLGSFLPTQYTYNPLGRLTSVVMGPQTRLFTYDGRGLQTSEKHPELGVAGNGTITYSNFDALGNATVKTVASNSRFNLSYEYDPAGRLRFVRQPAIGNRTLKEFEYYVTNNDPCNKYSGDAAGKLYRATRHNYVPDPALTSSKLHIPVTEIFRYEGSHGRVSKVETSVTRTVNATLTKDTFSQETTYDTLGNIDRLGYPCGICTGADARKADFDYTNGMLTKVSEIGPDGVLRKLADISYHPNGIVNQVSHSNGVTVTQSNGSNGMPRPSRIQTTGVTTGSGGNWDSLGYVFDGAGNIKSIGSYQYRYDKVHRVVSATLDGRSQSYSYDRYGNLITWTTDGVLTTFGSPGANRPGVGGDGVGSGGNGPDADDAGNLIEWKDPRRAPTHGTAPYRFTFDPFNMMVEMRGPVMGIENGLGRSFVYDADDERIVTLDHKADSAGVRQEHWTLRGPGNEVLREYGRTSTGVWSLKKDYIHRGGALLASQSPSDGTRHYHLDHLGTPRLITDGSAQAVEPGGRPNYLPFGQEVSPVAASQERRKFTGHERDDDGTSDQLSDFDYMHARYYMPMVGRFLSMDSVGGNPQRPQSWNRYSYSSNNPIGRVDSDGKADAPATVVIGENIKLLRSNIAGNGGQLNSVPRFALKRADVASAQFRSLLMHRGDVRSIGLDVTRKSSTIGPEMFAEFQANSLRFGAQTGNFGPASAIQKIGASHLETLEAVGSQPTRLGSAASKSIPILGALATVLEVATAYLELSEPVIPSENQARPPRGGWELYNFHLLLRTESAAREQRTHQPQ